MLLIEKVLQLKSSDIFSNTPEPELVELAGILEEIYLDENLTIFTKDEVGKCMYFIHKGSVRIHDGEHSFAVLGENEIFGELSLFDDEPRSASATTTQETILLKLNQEPFYEVLVHNTEILKGILKMLSRRLRIMDKKTVELKNTIAANAAEAKP